MLPSPDTAALRIAALPLLDRLLIATHRAGCSPIHVVATAPLPPLPRAQAWKVPFLTTGTFPTDGPPTPGLLLRADCLVQSTDLERLANRASPARLTTREGAPLPVGWFDPGTHEATAATAAGALDPFATLDALPAEPARGVACPVRNATEARAATRALWASITSGSDGFVDRAFNRPVGRPLSRLLVHTPVTPNAISVVSILIGVLAAALFALGTHTTAILAAMVFQLSAIIDCVDGDVARAAFKESALGKWLDLVGDQVVHLSVFLGIAAGLIRAGSGLEAAWLGISAAVGGALSFVVVLRGLRRARHHHAGDAAAAGRMQRILDAVTNRDFSVLVLALALANHLELFLWMAGLGSHVFWIGLLILQALPSTTRPPTDGPGREVR